jgi:hypothetical protein
MTLIEIFELAATIAALAVVRFGVPVALTWSIGRVLHRLEHS